MGETSTTNELKIKTSEKRQENVRPSRALRFVEEFERFYSNVLSCQNSKKIKIKWVR